jgi:hypothetical protein
MKRNKKSVKRRLLSLSSISAIPLEMRCVCQLFMSMCTQAYRAGCKITANLQYGLVSPITVKTYSFGVLNSLTPQ